MSGVPRLSGSKAAVLDLTLRVALSLSVGSRASSLAATNQEIPTCFDFLLTLIPPSWDLHDLFSRLNPDNPRLLCVCNDLFPQSEEMLTSIQLTPQFFFIYTLQTKLPSSSLRCTSITCS